jgi:hypothetical protein
MEWGSWLGDAGTYLTSFHYECICTTPFSRRNTKLQCVLRVCFFVLDIRDPLDPERDLSAIWCGNRRLIVCG